MNHKSLFKSFLIFSIAGFLSGCSGFVKIGSNLGDGLVTSTKGLGRELADGALNRLTDEKAKQQIASLIDSIVSVAGAGVNRETGELLDSLKNRKLELWIDQLVEAAVGKKTEVRIAALSEALTGVHTRNNLSAIRNDLLGYETDYRIRLMLDNAMNTVLGDATNMKITTIKDSLLGYGTRNSIKMLIDSAMLNIVYHLRENVNPQLQDNASFIKKYATELLITLALLAIGIIAFVWYSRRKYLKAVTLLTNQIQKIPDQKTYDMLTSRIRDNAVKAGIEPTLRKVLKENGMLGSEAWSNMQNKNYAS